jgi:hypothetical protein
MFQATKTRKVSQRLKEEVVRPRRLKGMPNGSKRAWMIACSMA